MRDELVLAVREVITFAVAILTILTMVLVQSANKDDKVSISSLGKGFILQALTLGSINSILLVIKSLAGSITLSV